MESLFVSELAPINQNDFDACSSATKISLETEDMKPATDETNIKLRHEDPQEISKIFFIRIARKPLSA